ncbi:hypothetical protein EJ07DRAFT_163038 [Lizonia empirigonia]|nr:hypothetical protein EJ07DRAFT_163038 [Lizonia empirigonia]
MRPSHRRAATIARSQLAAAARLAEEYKHRFESDSEAEKPTCKLARVSVANRPRPSSAQTPEWYVAIDFGTTFTTVASHRRGEPTDRINTINDFPEIWYPRKGARPSGHIKAGDIRLRFEAEVHRLAEDDEDIGLRKLYDDADRVTMMKLLLDDSYYAQPSKYRLFETLKALKSKDHIKENEDIIFHFFCEVFRATKTRLGPDFKDDSIVEVTFCMPVCYKPSAVAILGAQIERAMKQERFGTDGQSPCNLFVVHEAEAQAMQALRENLNKLERGECFILVDCGGGTTDIGIYRIRLTEPLRLASEVHEAMGAMVGAGDLNDRFRALVKRILRRERYLKNEDNTIDSIIEVEVMPKFETNIKRAFQYNDTEVTYSIRIRDLKESRDDERIQKNFLVLTYQDIWTIFQPSLEKISTMIENAVLNAKIAGYAVSKIVVVGGFGDSRCLQSYLLEQKNRLVRKLGSPLKLRFSPANTSATGVATGAIMRSMNKVDGPSRKPCQSIGILRHIPCDDENEEYTTEILDQPKKWNVQEEVFYVMDTIRWIVKKDGPMLDSVHTFTFVSEHLFEPDQHEWIISEHLWASETCTLDFYKLSHPKNAGKTTEIGAAEFDISHMKRMVRASNKREDVTLDKAVILVEMTVIDRNLEFIARWPATADGQIIQGSRKFFSVTSAFTPGTQ